MIKSTVICDGWEFLKSGLNTALTEALSSTLWQPVALPHDWLIWQINDLYESGIGWYKRILPVHLENGERCVIRFDGVYQCSTVYLNGEAVFEWKYGYSTFDVDITDKALDGDNEIVVRCYHKAPNSRWYSGAGIYRKVTMHILPRVHYAMDGIYVTPVRDGDTWHIDIDSEIVNPDGDPVHVRHVLMTANGKQVAQCEEDTAATESHLKIEGIAPRVWDLDSPVLYTLRSSLTAADTTDTFGQRIGFRTTEFSSDNGFLLNGRKVKLNGVCNHHDLGALGAAVNKTAVRRQLTILREMGVNAIRTSHNMPSVELAEACDEMGLLMDCEAFDMWEMHKTENDYATWFPEWYKKDVRSWIRRDRNRPCVIMWSIGNEIYDTHFSERGQEVTRMLRDAVRENDPRCHAPVTIGSNYMAWENAQKCADLLKVAGYNYSERYYDSHHQAHPDWVIYGSETFSLVQSRGIYHFPRETAIMSEDDMHCSSLGNSRTSWGAKSYDKCITDDRDTPFSMGQFLWSGFDYIGEPTPYDTKSCYFGSTDTAGFPKDCFYSFKGGWTDKPFVHLFPYWSFNRGQQIDVGIASNLPRVALYLNGTLIGEKDIDRKHDKELLAFRKLSYEEGEIRAVGYDVDGKPVCEDQRHSFGDAAGIVLEADKTAMYADCEDMIFVTVSMKDKDGYPVDNANNRVRVSVKGQAIIAGLDNGDPTDYDSYKCTSRRLFSGKLLIMLAATGNAGDILLRVESEGLPAAELRLISMKPAFRPKLPPMAACLQSPENHEIPVRRIEIVPQKMTFFSPEYPEADFKAVLSPANATYNDLSWRVTNDCGIDSPLAELTFDGDTAHIRARGDGMFYLRCAVNNGDTHPHIISQLECTVTGMGCASVVPYDFVYGGQFSKTYGNIGIAPERGFSSAPDAESIAVFEGLDFGADGSDTVTIPIYTSNDDLYRFDLYDGDPNAGGIFLRTCEYRKPSVWRIYQSETYHLPVRLKGTHTIGMKFRSMMDIRGFVFTSSSRAYSENNASDCDAISGDSFRKEREAVYGIGNNVTLTFSRMEFGPNNGLTLYITGRTALKKNSIRLCLSSGDDEKTWSLEFENCSDWTRRAFKLPAVYGVCDVSFIFMPGSAFDFKTFQFEKE